MSTPGTPTPSLRNYPLEGWEKVGDLYQKDGVFVLVADFYGYIVEIPLKKLRFKSKADGRAYEFIHLGKI